MKPRASLALTVWLAWLGGALCVDAQDRNLGLEDVIKERAGHLSLSGAWIGGGAFDLSFPDANGNNTLPSQRAYSSSAGLSLTWTYLGARTTGWGNFAGDYSLASRSSLDSLSHFGELGLLRRISPRFSLGVMVREQSLNLGARLFSQPSAARALQSAGFGGVGPSPGLGGSTDPVSEAGATLPNIDTFALTLGGNQRNYTAGLIGGMNFTPRTDFRFGASVSQSEYPQTAGANIQLPYGKLLGAYGQGALRHSITARTSVIWSFQTGQNYAQNEKLSFVSTTLGVSRILSSTWYAYASGGGGVSSVFQLGVKIPWLFRYTGQGGLAYAGQKQGFILQATQDTGDRFALGFESTSQVNAYWNLRPPASGWALGVRAGAILLQAKGEANRVAETAQLGLSRRLFGHVYALAEGTYVTNVIYVPQRLFPTTGGNSSLLDTASQRAVRISIVYRPAPDRK